MNTELISKVTYCNKTKTTSIMFDGEKETLPGTTKNFAINLAYHAKVKLENYEHT